MSQDQKGGLVALGAAFEHIDQVRVGIILHVLPVHLQEDVPLRQLGTPGVVHDQLHHRTNGRLTYKSHDMHMTQIANTVH